jgi:hypothetical protein
LKLFQAKEPKVANTGKLDINWINRGYELNKNPGVDTSGYNRVEGVWNIYFHGFMDRFDDIAYVEGSVTIEPGIYETTAYGEKCYLFLWVADPTHPRTMKGLITRISDTEQVVDALAKYISNQSTI